MNGLTDIFYDVVDSAVSAIFYGLNGELFEALHILAPQMEKLFRTIAEASGSVMAELEKNFLGIESFCTKVFSFS